MNEFLGTDGTFTSAKDTAAAAGIIDLASIGISNGDYVDYGIEYCHFECPYQEWIQRKFRKNLLFVSISVSIFDPTL